MGFLDRFRSREPGPGSEPVRIGDPAYDDWPVLRDFEDLASARSWLQHLRELGFEAVLTSDWPLDRFDRGDVSLRVPAESWADASDALEQE